MTEMRCDECRAMLDGYVDGQLAPHDAARIRDHLDQCGACAAEHKMLSEVSTRLRRAIGRPVAPDVLKARVRADLARSESARPAPTRRRGWQLAAAGLLLAVVSAGSGAYFAQLT